MITWFRRFLYDEATFHQYVRFLLGFAALMVPQLVDLGAPGWWGSKVALACALFIRTGGISTDERAKLAALPSASSK